VSTMRVATGNALATTIVAATLALLPLPASSAPADDSDIAVHVVKDGPEISVVVDFAVDAPANVAWDVPTDYVHMADFVSNVEASRIQQRDGDRLQVYQKGKATRGPLTFGFENVRAVELVPQKAIHSRMISGDLKASEFSTRIVAGGGQVRIVNQGRYTPKIWVPPVIGPALIEAETRKQFGEIRAEMLRRSKLQASSGQTRPLAGESAAPSPLAQPVN